MNSLAKLWHRENDPDSEVDLLILQHVASVHETGGDKPVCEEPKTPLSHDESGWDCIDDTSCLTTHLSRRREPKKFLSSESLVSKR